MKTGGDLEFARSINGGAFSTSTIESAGDVGSYTSIEVYYDGTNDIIHISYYDSSNGDLKYAKSTDNGASFSTEIVDNGGGNMVGKYTSIALDSNHNPHISYYDETNRDLKYAYYDGSTWIKRAIDTNFVGEFSSIAIHNDYVHISYYEGNNGDLKYALADNVGGNFSIETINDPGIVGFFTSIAVNGNNKPYISYYDFSLTQIKYAEKTGDDWNIVEVPGGTPNMDFTSIALDSQDLANISYTLASDEISLARYLP